MIICDLHIHTTFSDGIHTPDEIADIAVRRKVACLSVSDHDTLEGLPQAMQACARRAVRFIPCAEISCGPDGRTHILSYLSGVASPSLQRYFSEIRDERRERALKTIEKLQELGYRIDSDRITAESTVGRPHIARELVRNGYFKTVDDVFEHVLGDNCPAFVPLSEQKPEKIIRIIRDSYGVPVLAHPALLKLSMTELEKKVRFWKESGLAGIEVFHPSQRSNYLPFIRLAESLSLLKTGGSDHHVGISGKDEIAETASDWLTAENDLLQLESALAAANRSTLQ